jgi:hypothetical protein
MTVKVAVTHYSANDAVAGDANAHTAMAATNSYGRVSGAVGRRKS